MLLEDADGIELVALLLLGGDLLEDGAEVRDVLLGLGPFRLGQDLLLQAELGGAADAVDAVVLLLGGEAGEGLEDGLVVFGDEVVGPGEGLESVGLVWER